MREGLAAWTPLGAAALIGAVLALGGVLALRPAPSELPPGARLVVHVPDGESHDGEVLPVRHPWRAPVVLPTAAASAAASTVADVEPLRMRRDCAWGKPGRNPYRGTVEQALLHARLPLEVVREIDRQVRAREFADRLEIRRGRIVGVRHGREFDADAFAMSFGRTLCLNSRVNFVAGHVEGADLHEATDALGRHYAVMVPDVCGNVSVLTERGQVAGVRAERDPEWEYLARGGEPDATVDEPGTLAGALGALALLALLRRRRVARGPAAG